MSEQSEDRLSRQRSKLEAALKALREKERDREQRRYAIVGRAVLSRAERDPAYREALMGVLDAELGKSSERELFGLSPGTGRRGRRRREEGAAEGGPPEREAEAPTTYTGNMQG